MEQRRHVVVVVVVVVGKLLLYQVGSTSGANMDKRKTWGQGEYSQRANVLIGNDKNLHAS
jgi:hypothetical protein